jgi:hypothetical protein
MEAPSAAEAVKSTVTARTLLNALKENRLEVIGITILAHLLGLTDRALGHVQGVCF